MGTEEDFLPFFWAKQIRKQQDSRHSFHRENISWVIIFLQIFSTGVIIHGTSGEICLLLLLAASVG